MATKVFYQGEQTNLEIRRPSPKLWSRIGWQQVRRDMGLGYFYETDFLDFPVMADATAQGPWITRQDSSCTIQGTATTTGGVVSMITDTTDNNEVYLEFGAGKGGLVKISKNFGRLCFETRVKYSSVTNDVASSFVGLTEEGAAVANFVADGGASLAVKDWVGFEILNDDGDGMNAVHATASGARVEVEANTTAPTADTYIKLGLYYDGEETLSYYVNGSPTATVDIDNTNFPDGEELVPFWGFKNGGSAAFTLSIDWFRLCQELI